MKKKSGLKNSLGTKNIILAIVALVLIMVTVIGASFSWIEEVSQVEFNSESGQQTPLHVGNKVLKADAVMKNNPTTAEVNLADYFNESGDMHLSPCYGDGDDFYFPVQKSSTGSIAYRKGTKDDANVNYLSATFRVKSDNANTAYWFEKVNSSTDFITCKKSNNASIDLKKYLRISVTVDGNTNVYAYNSDGSYITVANNATSTKTGRKLADYMYYTESFNDSAPVDSNGDGFWVTDSTNSGRANQGAGSNLNGNTLFTVNKYDANKKKGMKEVTVKIWMQYNGSGIRDVRVSNVNLKITSSWAKTRRVYVKDATVHQEGYDSAKWLGTYSATLHWGIKDDLANKHWPLKRVSSSSDYYYCNIPAVYNNSDVVLFRCSSSGYNNGNKTYTGGSSNISCWNYWETTFPDTFHAEVYTVYSTDFGTWNTKDVNNIFIVNSTFFNDMYDYMWDSNSVIQGQESNINGKVVKNADWPGIKMTTEMKTKTSSQSLKTYAFFYNADYDRIIFNDGDVVSGQNQEYQTQDLWLTNSSGQSIGLEDCTFDMTTLTWFHTNPTKNDWSSKMPSYTGSNTYIYGNFSTNNQWKKTRFAYGGEYSSTSGNAFNGSSSTHMLCKIYCKAGNDYEFKLCYNGNWYGAYNNGDKRVTPNSNYYIDGTLIPNNYGLTLDNDHTSNFIMTGINAKDIIRIYFDTNEKKLYFAKGEN